MEEGEGFGDLCFAFELLADHVSGKRAHPLAALLRAVGRITELLPLLHQRDESEPLFLF